jgi:hypothetical protein
MLEYQTFLNNSMNAKLVSGINVYMEMEEVCGTFAMEIGMYLMVQGIHISPKTLRKRRLCSYSTFREVDRMANEFVFLALETNHRSN